MAAPQSDERNTIADSGNEKPRSEADAELEREIRAGRQFSLADAIGRMAGPGMMKGVSPITRKQQAETEIESFLRLQLSDSGAELGIALLRRVSDSEMLLKSYDHPLVVLAGYVERVLETPHLLTDLVCDADVEWGRVFDERPYFQKEGSSPNPNDPYTLESVRGCLAKLLETLKTAKT